MTERQNQPSVAITPLSPLSSTIRTFLGVDKEHGPVYTRLEYLPLHEQAKYIPKILKGLVARLETTDPDYIASLAVGLASKQLRAQEIKESDGASGAIAELAAEPEWISEHKALEATEPEAISAHEAYKTELKSGLVNANDVQGVAEVMLTKSILNQRTKELSPTKLRHVIGLANNIFADDPLVRISREAAALLDEDNLRQLGQLTVGAAAAVVDYSGLYHVAESVTPLGDPNAAA